MNDGHRLVSLSDFLPRAVPHERVPTSLGRGPWLGGLASTGLLGVYLLMLLLAAHSVENVSQRPGFFIFGWGLVAALTTFGHHALAGVMLTLVELAGAGYLAWVTKGFQVGAMREVVGVGGLLVAGLVAAIQLTLVLLVCALILALWLAAIAFVLAMICAVFDLL